jgi:hypothetical protein
MEGCGSVVSGKEEGIWFGLSISQWPMPVCGHWKVVELLGSRDKGKEVRSLGHALEGDLGYISPFFFLYVFLASLG